MTYHVIKRGSLYSDLLLSDNIYNASIDTIPDDVFEQIKSDIVTEVNANLPGSLTWTPETSEILADISDESDIEEDDFQTILDSAFWAAFEKNGL